MAAGILFIYFIFCFFELCGVCSDKTSVVIVFPLLLLQQGCKSQRPQLTKTQISRKVTSQARKLPYTPHLPSKMAALQTFSLLLIVVTASVPSPNQLLELTWMKDVCLDLSEVQLWSYYPNTRWNTYRTGITHFMIVLLEFSTN